MLIVLWIQQKNRTPQKSAIIYGKKTISPTATEAKTNSKTAPAPTSFAIFISGSRSFDTLSEIFSIAVLNDSAMNTPPMQSNTEHHSHRLISKNIPAANTQTLANKCILACDSCLNKYFIPCHAYLNAAFLL